MSDTSDFGRDIGRIEATQDAHATRLERIEAKVDQLIETVSTARGGIRWTLAVGSGFGALSAAGVELLHWLGRSPR